MNRIQAIVLQNAYSLRYAWIIIPASLFPPHIVVAALGADAKSGENGGKQISATPFDSHCVRVYVEFSTKLSPSYTISQSNYGLHCPTFGRNLAAMRLAKISTVFCVPLIIFGLTAGVSAEHCSCSPPFLAMAKAILMPHYITE